MNILGLNCYMHDSSVALINNGKLVAMAEEERFNRQKHTNEFPRKALEFCLSSEFTPNGFDDIDEVGFFWVPWKGLLNRFGLITSNFPQYINHPTGRPTILRNMLKIRRFLKEQYGYRKKFRFVDHHMAHAASTFFTSPFDDAAVMVIDGNGEILTSSGYSGSGNKLERMFALKYPHSLGLLYLCVTEYLGFEENSGEGKVMGLASYGKPIYYDKFREIVDFDDNGKFKLDLSYFDVHISRENYITRKFTDKFGPRLPKGAEPEQRHCDIAASLQKITEDAAMAHLRFLHRKTGKKNLCLSGGVALNSVMNGKILSSTPFEKLFVFPAASDIGCSLGAALYIWHIVHKQKERYILEHPYWGPSFSDERIKAAINREAVGCENEWIDDPAGKAAEVIAAGNITGWFQGRMEIGPRALGNRSILADPRKAEMKDILNKRVKHRESFRPFAPSIKEERVSEYFETTDLSPYMLRVSNVREEKRKEIPAVTHVDGTGRVQTVSEKVNPLYYRLIDEFEKITGVPVVINTSFNIRGEPIVCSPEDAIYCFLKTEIDYLFIGHYMLTKINAGGKHS